MQRHVKIDFRIAIFQRRRHDHVCGVAASFAARPRSSTCHRSLTHQTQSLTVPLSNVLRFFSVSVNPFIRPKVEEENNIQNPLPWNARAHGRRRTILSTKPNTTFNSPGSECPSAGYMRLQHVIVEKNFMTPTRSGVGWTRKKTNACNAMPNA